MSLCKYFDENVVQESIANSERSPQTNKNNTKCCQVCEINYEMNAFSQIRSKYILDNHHDRTTDYF